MVVDACVFVAFFNSSDLFHKRSVTWLQDHSIEKIEAPIVILAELASALIRMTNDKQLVVDSVELMKKYFTLHEIDESFTAKAIDVALKYRLRDYDCFYVALAKKLRKPLVTFDKEVAKRFPRTLLL